jgi:hypothetical protein
MLLISLLALSLPRPPGRQLPTVVGATKLIDTKKSPLGPQNIPNAKALSREQNKSRRFEELVLLMKLCLLVVGYF